MAITWNPSDKAADLALSGGNLIATGTGALYRNRVRATASKSGGKWYWEVVANNVVDAGADGAGIANATFNITSGQYIGGDQHGMQWYADGTLYYNGSSVLSVPTFTDGDVLCFALDDDANTIQVRKNNGSWSSTASTSGVTGALFACCSPEANTAQFTLRALASSFGYSIPSGYSAYEASGTAYNQSLSISNNAVAGISRQAGKPLRATTTPIRAIAKAVTKALSITTTPTRQIARQANKSAQATSTPVASLASARVVLKSVLAATQPVASIVRQAGKILTAWTTPTLSLARAVTKSLLSTTTPIRTIQKAGTKTLQAASTPAAAVAKLKAVFANLLASTTPVALITRRTGKPLAAVNAASAAVTKVTSKRLSATTTPTRSLSSLKVLLKTLQAVTTPVPGMKRQVGKVLRATVAVVAALAKIVNRTLPSAPAPWHPPGYLIPPFGFAPVGIAFLPWWADAIAARTTWSEPAIATTDWIEPDQALTIWRE